MIFEELKFCTTFGVLKCNLMLTGVQESIDPWEQIKMKSRDIGQEKCNYTKPSVCNAY